MDDPELDNHWTAISIESVTPDGFPRNTLHTPKGELIEVRDEILEELDNIPTEDPLFDDFDGDFHEDSVEHGILPRELSRKIVSVFAISVGIMEEQAIDILQYELFSGAYSDHSAVIELVERRGFRKNIDLINELGLLGDGEAGQIHAVRNARNDFVHDPRERLKIKSTSRFEDTLNKTVRAPEYLHEIRNDILS